MKYLFERFGCYSDRLNLHNCLGDRVIHHIKIDLPASVRSELEMNIHIMISELIVGGEALSTEVTPETHCITVGRETTTHL